MPRRPRSTTDAPDVMAPAKPSKSARKREAEAAQHLGKELLDVPPEVLAAFPLDAELREEVVATRTRQKEARRRSLQHIGVLMRQTDIGPIRAALKDWREGRHKVTANDDRARIWRDALVAGDETVIDVVMETMPSLDRDHLTELARLAVRERNRGAPPRQARLLYRYLRDGVVGAADAED